ncbi:PH domain-containing protein [Chloroflexota bacterium]
MNYSKSVLLYQDEPAYGLILKLIIMIVPVASLVGSIYLFLSGNTIDASLLLVEACVVSLIFWCVFPRKYQVYEAHLSIVLGGPFSVKIRFDNVKSIDATSRPILSVNFVTRLTKNYVSINKKKGLSVAITPRDNDLFVENANEAMSQWVKTN